MSLSFYDSVLLRLALQTLSVFLTLTTCNVMSHAIFSVEDEKALIAPLSIEGGHSPFLPQARHSVPRHRWCLTSLTLHPFSHFKQQ